MIMVVQAIDLRRGDKIVEPLKFGPGTVERVSPLGLPESVIVFVTGKREKFECPPHVEMTIERDIEDPLPQAEEPVRFPWEGPLR